MPEIDINNYKDNFIESIYKKDIKNGSLVKSEDGTFPYEKIIDSVLNYYKDAVNKYGCSDDAETIFKPILDNTIKKVKAAYKQAIDDAINTKQQKELNAKHNRDNEIYPKKQNYDVQRDATKTEFEENLKSLEFKYNSKIQQINEEYNKSIEDYNINYQKSIQETEKCYVNRLETIKVLFKNARKEIDAPLIEATNSKKSWRSKGWK